MSADRITMTAAMATTGMSDEGIRAAVNRGELACERLGPAGLRTFDRADVEAFAARRAGAAAARDAERVERELEAARRAGERAAIARGRWYSSRELHAIVDAGGRADRT